MLTRRILSGRSLVALAVSQELSLVGGYDRGLLQPQPALAMPLEAQLASKKRTGDMRSFFKASSIADKTKQEQLDERFAASHFSLKKFKADANAALQRRMEANHAANKCSMGRLQCSRLWIIKRWLSGTAPEEKTNDGESDESDDDEAGEDDVDVGEDDTDEIDGDDDADHD